MLPALNQENSIVYCSKLSTPVFTIYWTILILVIISLTSLPFIYFNITVKTSGIIRPINERTDVRSMKSGIIDTILYNEGGSIPKGSAILRLRDNQSSPKKILNMYELEQTQQFIDDLQMLTIINQRISYSTLFQLHSPLYKQQVSRYIYELSVQESALKKVRKEIDINNKLIKDNIIAPKEQFDKEIESEKLNAAYNAFKNEQLSIWQQHLSKYKLEYSQLKAQLTSVLEDEKLYSVNAPVSGIILGINTHYSGGVIQAGETVCTISPEAELVAECYVPTHEVGLLAINQKVHFQIDAFDYNFFGVISGKIVTIDNDFTLVENKPLFIVRCLLDRTQLNLKNGFKGNLKKGLTLQARFIVTRRTAWQLLFDKLDDWFNPVSPRIN